MLHGNGDLWLHVGSTQSLCRSLQKWPHCSEHFIPVRQAECLSTLSHPETLRQQREALEEKHEQPADQVGLLPPKQGNSRSQCPVLTPVVRTGEAGKCDSTVIQYSVVAVRVSAIFLEVCMSVCMLGYIQYRSINQAQQRAAIKSGLYSYSC